MTFTEDPRPAVDTTAVPFRMTSGLHVPRERYFDRDFYELEKEHLWGRVWQMACRLQEIPEPGDYTEYEICDQSVLIVRQADRSVKAYHNVCPHRATQLCTGAGHAGGNQLRCPFHGWRWNLDGTVAFLYGEEGFDPTTVQPDDTRLREVRCDTWGACAWITFDDDAVPLAEYLAPAAHFLDLHGMEHLQVWWWKEVVLDANWKVAQEAFLEGWHVMATHPQLTMGVGEAYPAGTTEHTVFPHGHSRFQGAARPSLGGGNTDADAFIARSRRLWEGQDAMTLERDLHVFESLRTKVPPEENFATHAVAALYEYAVGAGIPMPPPGENARLWGGEIFLFPNFLVLPMYGNALSYRSRPHEDDPEKCRFEIWSLTMYPESFDAGRATLKGRFAKDDVDNWGLIPRQDIANIERQQRGYHSRGFTESILSPTWEVGIAGMHQEVDRYLARGLAGG